MGPLSSFDTLVPYASVDRDNCLRLAAATQLLQEAAIRHANEWQAGIQLAARGQTWVLNRLSLRLHRYPRFGENVRVETWSRGIRGFRGYREFRISTPDACLIEASSLWLFLDLRHKALVRVPADIADSFPTLERPVAFPDLDRRESSARSAPMRHRHTVSLRYSDFDGNGHVNNTTYFELIQTALAHHQLPARPHLVHFRFLREIPLGQEAVAVELEPADSVWTVAIRAEAEVFAVGEVTLPRPEKRSPG